MRSFYLGSYLIEPSKGTISSEYGTTAVEPKAMSVLCKLKEKQGQVVSQEELFNSVWPNRIFSPSSVQRVIAIIRRALNETSQSPTFIFTHPKRGYRLEVPEMSLKTNGTLRNSSYKVHVWLGLALVILILLGAIVFFKFKKDLPLNIRQVSHSQAKEFNSKFSWDGELLSYQSGQEKSRLYVAEVANITHIKVVKFKHRIMDYVWRDDTILAITQEESGQLLLEQQFANNPLQDSQVVSIMGKWDSVSELQLGKNGDLWFIGNHENEPSSIFRYDIISRKLSSVKSLGYGLISASLSYSTQGLYFHSYDGVDKVFGIVDENSNMKILEGIETPNMSSLSWSEKEQHLLVSDQLNTSQYRYSDGQLIPYTLSSEFILNEIAIGESFFSATVIQKDMDVWEWHRSKDKLDHEIVVNSKYSDYNAIKNVEGSVAFLSSRNSYPQVFLQGSNEIKIVFENFNKVPFVASMLFSESGKELALVTDNSISFVNLSIEGSVKREGLNDVLRLFQWKDNLIVYLSTSGYPYIYDMDSGKRTKIDRAGAVFSAINEQGELFGATEFELFNGKVVKPIETITSRKIKHILGVRGYLFLHVETLADQSELIVLDSRLEVQSNNILGTKCDHLTYVNISGASVNWMCTDVDLIDEDIVLIEKHSH